MKSNKGVALGILAAFVVIVTGCGDNNIKNDHIDDQAYIKEGNGEENAVNTLQVGTKYKIVGPMDELRDAVIVMMGENYWPDKQLTVAELRTETGITEEMYDDFLAEKMNIETDIDIMIILKAKAKYLPEIEKMLNAYRDSLLVKYRERPQELGKVQASRIEVIEPYICFVQLGADTEAAIEKGDEEVIALCQQENERAVDIIEKTILNQ